MTEQEKQQVAVQVQGCRRWMGLIILMPVVICGVFILLTPNIRDFLSRAEAKQQCQRLTAQYEAVSNSIFIEDNSIAGEAVITRENIGQMVLFDEIVLDTSIPARDVVPAVRHPNGDYGIYANRDANSPTNFFICASDGMVLGAFSAEARAGDIVFNADGSQFAVTEGESGQIILFDGIEIGRLGTIDVGDEHQIDAIAFHPTQGLLFLTAEDELLVYDLESLTQILQTPLVETQGHNIAFNAEGTLFYLVETGGNQAARVWGVRD